MNKFAEKLKELRLEGGYSQSELANLMELSKQNISDWENRKSETNFDMLIKLAKFFGVTTDYLLGLDD